ncbi:hypothetical protein [Devosia sp. CAU 1758]
MPVRARKSRRRDVRAEKEAWSMFFQSGFDFFNDLRDMGVETNQNGVPADDVAREAWQRLGRRFLDEFEGQPSQHGHYGVRVFGEPGR